MRLSSEEAHACLVKDYSDGGVRLQANRFEVPDDFVLVFAPHEPAQRGRYRVVWCCGKDVGAKHRCCVIFQEAKHAPLMALCRCFQCSVARSAAAVAYPLFFYCLRLREEMPAIAVITMLAPISASSRIMSGGIPIASRAMRASSNAVAVAAIMLRIRSTVVIAPRCKGIFTGR